MELDMNVGYESLVKIKVNTTDGKSVDIKKDVLDIVDGSYIQEGEVGKYIQYSGRTNTNIYIVRILLDNVTIIHEYYKPNI